MIKLLGFKIGKREGSALNDEIQIAVSPETLEDIQEMYEKRAIKIDDISILHYCSERARALDEIRRKYREKREGK